MTSHIEKNRLLKELSDKGIGYDRKQIIWVHKNNKGKITFCEKHRIDIIYEKHGDNFEKFGVTKEQLPCVLKEALIRNEVTGEQGKYHETPRPIYETVVNGERVNLAISVSDKGFIVGANMRGRAD